MIQKNIALDFSVKRKKLIFMKSSKLSFDKIKFKVVYYVLTINLFI